MTTAQVVETPVTFNQTCSDLRSPRQSCSMYLRSNLWQCLLAWIASETSSTSATLGFQAFLQPQRVFMIYLTPLKTQLSFQVVVQATWRFNHVYAISLYSSGFILEIGQWGSNGPPSVILGGLFSRKGIAETVSPKRYLNLLVQTVPWEKQRLLKLSFTNLQVPNVKLKWL